MMAGAHHDDAGSDLRPIPVRELLSQYPHGQRITGWDAGNPPDVERAFRVGYCIGAARCGACDLDAAADLADPRVLASSVGLIYSLHAVGFVAPAVAGYLAERSGMGAAYVCAAFLFLAAGAVATALRRSGRGGHTDHANPTGNNGGNDT